MVTSDRPDTWRLVLGPLLGAGASAVGIGLTILDIGDRIGSPNRRYVAGLLFLLFVGLVGTVLRRCYGLISSQQDQIDALRHAEPRIRFQQIGGPTKIAMPSTGSVQRRMEIWQLWFVNDPITRGAAAVARDLRAVVQFCDSEWKAVLAFAGQWVITQMPDHVGWSARDQLKSHIENMTDTIDLSLSPARGKLQLLGQGRDYLKGGQRDVHALAGENFHEYPDTWQHPHYRVPRDAIRIRVVLSAENMNEQEFSFAITRSGDGTVNAVTELRF